LAGATVREPRRPGFWPLAIVFALFVLFLYGPVITIFVLSFQGPEGGLTLPMRGLSMHWYAQLWQGLGVVDIASALRRSLALGAVVMLLTVLFSLGAGLAFRKKLRGGDALFYVTVASLIMPSIVVSLGIGLQFRLVDVAIKALLESAGASATLEGYTTSLGLYTSGLGAHLTWTLPFGLLIMFAVFNRFNPAYEEAARDLGATPWQSLRHVVLPLIAPSVVGVGMFGFTLSWDEIARSSQAIGDLNTLPLELQGLTTTVTTPAIYALGTVTTGIWPWLLPRCWGGAGARAWADLSAPRQSPRTKPPLPRQSAAPCGRSGRRRSTRSAATSLR
jgi:putative spermidine/putrescine transport system permease protein